MSAPLPSDDLACAWQAYDRGDLPEALALARNSWTSANTPAAAAALGYFLLSTQGYDDAEEMLLHGLQLAPHGATLHWYLGLLHHRQGRTQRGIASLRRACQLNPALDEAAFTLAWCLDELGQLPEAQLWAARALEARRLPPRLLLWGWLQQRQGELRGAMATYQEAMALYAPTAPEQIQLHLHLAQCLLALGQPEQARHTYRHGLEQHLDSPALATAAALLEWDQGHGQRALDIAQAHAERCPDSAPSWHLLGVLQERVGRRQLAEQSLNRVLAQEPEHVDALVRQAFLHQQRASNITALALAQYALRLEPGHRLAQTLAIQLLLEQTATDDARRQLHRSLTASPQDSELWRLLAVACRQRQRPQAAQRALRRALRWSPDNIEALRLMTWLLLEQGDTDAAVTHLQRLLTLRPVDEAAWTQAAFVFTAAQRFDHATHYLGKVMAANPADCDAWRALAELRYRQHRLEEAEAAIRHAGTLAPERIDCLRQLGWILLAANRTQEAEQTFLRVLAQHPDNRLAQQEAAQACLRHGNFAQGLALVEQMLAQAPADVAAQRWSVQLLTEGQAHWPDAHARARQQCQRLLTQAQLPLPELIALLLRLLSLGTDTSDLLAQLPPQPVRHKLQQAMAHSIGHHGHAALQRLAAAARSRFADDPWLSTAALYAASLRQDMTRPALALAARNWYRQLKLRTGLAPFTAQVNLVRQGKPRIGYLVGQHHERLLHGLLHAHDPAQVEVFVYTCHALGPLPGHIRVEPLDPPSLLESFNLNGIDIAIDVGGLHPFEGQIGLLECYAQRLAPLQVGWLGCWGSAGGLFDVLLADEASVPPAHVGDYEESVHYLPGGQWCWSPPLHTPPVSPRTAQPTSAITFGVTARGLRLDPGSLERMADILQALPDARLRFLGATAQDWPQRAELQAQLCAAGIAAERVTFEPWQTYDAFLHWLQAIDIVLDTTPGNGGLSLLEPLWMGVPVVTLAGAWAGARQGCSVLTALGLAPQLVAHDDAGYVRLAVALARDTAGLATLRAGLRQRMRASPLLDGNRLARAIEAMAAHWLPSCREPALAQPKPRVRALAQRALTGWLAKQQPLTLPTPSPDDTPALSVIVILYKQPGLSRLTLQALADQRGVTFETLIVDNDSRDDTAALLDRVQGARLIRNTDNLGFLLAANQAAAQARGRYIVLLNSDAILQPDALSRAWRRMEADPTIGALGGRIVLMQGGLQEAGNRIFQDGSAMGIGRGEDPFQPAALASRTTDYCSGALLVVPSELWRTLEGFDPIYAPAYYEDTDLCVRIWQAGRRVVYDPSVLVEHVEWGSATATDEAPRQIRRNRARFVARHHAWLQQRQEPNPQRLQADRWHAPDDLPRKPRVLILDNQVPHHLHGAGLPRARRMLQALTHWPVTFYPLWSLDDDWQAIYDSVPDTVEVMLHRGLAGLEQFLSERQGVYDTLVVSRPPNLAAIAPLRARRPELFRSLRIIYDAEALFALREIGEAAVRDTPLSGQAARHRLTTELALAQETDHVLVVSNRDAGHFRQAGYPTTLLRHAVDTVRHAPGLADRAGLLFIGPLHENTPNEDGLCWFIDHVLPRVQAGARHPVTLTVVGLCRSAAILQRASATVRLVGAQPDLQPYYDAARVFVAPARYAGGIPLKVVEATAQGVPTVASALLARQLDWRSGRELQSATDAAGFAAAILRLLHDDSLWERQRMAAWQRCEQEYAPAEFDRTLQELLMPAITQRPGTQSIRSLPSSSGRHGHTPS